MQNECFILTDKTNFTTCTPPTPSALEAESIRLALTLPIRIFHWKRVNGSGPLCGWKLLATSTWDGKGMSWR